MSRRAALLVFFTGLCLLWTPGLEAREKAAGDRAYRLRALQTVDQQVTSLAREGARKQLVVVVMKGVGCAVCVAQLERLARYQKQLSALRATVVAISHDSPAKIRQMLKQRKIAFPVLSDPQHRVLEALGLWRPRWGHPLPSIVIFDRCGDERGRLEGRGPRARPERSLFRLLQRLHRQRPKCAWIASNRTSQKPGLLSRRKACRPG